MFFNLCVDYKSVGPDKLLHNTEFHQCLHRLQKQETIFRDRHSAILLTIIKLRFVIKVFVLSICQWTIKTDLTDYRLMQIKSNAECSRGTIIKLRFVIKVFVLSIFKLLIKTGFTVLDRVSTKLGMAWCSLV